MTCTVLRSLDVFTADVYRRVLIEGLAFAQEHKGLDVYAWCVMTHQLHLIVGRHGTYPLGRIIGAFKAHTSKVLRDVVASNPDEQTRDWLMWMFERLGKRNPNNWDFQFWEQDGSMPVLLEDRAKALELVDSVHLAPVRAGYVEVPEHWLWSSAGNYQQKFGLLENVILIE